MLRVLTFVLAMLAAASSWANALTPDDQQRFGNFLRKAQAVRQEVAAAMDAQASSACLLELGTANAFLDDLTSLYALVATDVAMVDQRDEMIVQYYLKEEIRAFRGISDEQENLINQSLSGGCASSEALAASGQDLLRLLDDASSLVEGIDRKLGR
jgi:hypothetical protein